MIALDTNVLVRLIVRDDEEQLQRARDLVERAISVYEVGTGGFADHLIGETSRSAGASVVYTFDGGLAAGPGFAMP